MNAMLNVSTADAKLGLVRAACKPSMRAGVYTVSAWYLRASGNIAGAHCECVAGLSETCQHVAGLLFAVADKGAVPDENKPSCTDLPCKWIVPSEAKKPALKLPLQEIPFHRNVINKPPCLKQPRNYNPSQKVTRYEDIVKLKTRLQDMLPALLHFVKHALIPEMVTKRVKRLGKLYTCGQYVSYKKLQQGFYVCSPVDESLTLKIRKLK
ncbi:hypothetical protein HPB49_004678 [Dermacentor silvarum]|uniref:Uncharacterized protein n=1 Tax=Dermacentor silvarum TaxID=543639 RepID=A0ACB8C271_DERSI|nr:hypothetical protein HPB49_004678 [Dermacentor silvarum]